MRSSWPASAETRAGRWCCCARAHEAARDSQGTLARELLIGLGDAPGLAGAPPRALAALAELVPPVRERFTQLPASEGWTLANATVRVLADVAAEWPVVLFVDDIAGADRLSQELIQSLADGLRDAPILFLITVRSDDPPSSAIAALRARYGLRRVLLRPLDLAETERLLASMLEMAPPECRRLAERLHGESPANPYFLIQTVSALLDEGRVVPAGDGTSRLHVDSAVHPLPVSAGIRDAVRSRLEPIKAVARSTRSHRELILNWFKAKKEFNSGIVEGLNYKIKLTIRKAYGYRELKVAEIAIYHALGQLPEPELTHRFC